MHENSLNHLQLIQNENTSSMYAYDDASVQQDVYPFENRIRRNQQLTDSLSNLSERKKRIIVRVVTIFSIIMFLICFGMIALTLRLSENIDAKSIIT